VNESESQGFQPASASARAGSSSLIAAPIAPSCAKVRPGVRISGKNVVGIYGTDSLNRVFLAVEHWSLYWHYIAAVGHEVDR